MKRISLETKKSWQGFLFILPWFLGFLFLFLRPFISAIIYSFGNVSVETGSLQNEFVGMTHYIYAFTGDEKFPEHLRNRTAVSGAAGFILQLVYCYGAQPEVLFQRLLPGGVLPAYYHLMWCRTGNHPG